MDGVIADALPKHLALYNAEFHARLTLDDLHGQHLGDVVHADHRARLEEYLAAEGFFADLPVIADSVAVISDLYSTCDPAARAREFFRRLSKG